MDCLDRAAVGEPKAIAMCLTACLVARGCVATPEIREVWSVVLDDKDTAEVCCGERTVRRQGYCDRNVVSLLGLVICKGLSWMEDCY